MNNRAERRQRSIATKARAVELLRLRQLPCSARWVGIMAATPAVCSCWMCGNPRRFFGELTRQEMLHTSGLCND